MRRERQRSYQLKVSAILGEDVEDKKTVVILSKLTMSGAGVGWRARRKD